MATGLQPRRSSSAALLLAPLGLWSAIISGATAASSSGCGSPAPGPLQTMNQVNLTLSKSMGGTRPYYYWLPPTYEPSKPAPVVFAFHGATESAEIQSKIDLFTDPYFNPNSSFIVVYPEATILEDTRQRFWEVDPRVAELGINDVGYVEAILDDIEKHICVDENRIYSTGMSQGGGMTNLLACTNSTSTRFAAFATVAGAFYYPSPSGGGDKNCRPASDKLPCDPGRDNIPLLAFHGAADPTIPYRGGERKGECVPDIRHWISLWADRNDLDTKTSSFSAPVTIGTSPSRSDELGGSAERYIWGQGDKKGLVQFVYDGNNVGHIWPNTFESNTDDGDAREDGPTKFNASSLIMDFFGRYTLDGSPVIPSVAPNTTTDVMAPEGSGSEQSPHSAASRLSRDRVFGSGSAVLLPLAAAAAVVFLGQSI